MARNLTELNQELERLEHRRLEQVEQLKKDAEALQELFKPTNIIKRSISSWLTKPSSGGNSISSNLANMAGTFLIDQVLLKKSGFLVKILGSILASGLFNDVLKGDDSTLKKWATQLSDWVRTKQPESGSTPKE